MLVEAVCDVDADPAGRQFLAETDSSNRFGHQRRAQCDLADQLWPGGQGVSDLDQGCGHPWRQSCAVHHAEGIWNLVLARQLRQLREVHVAQQAMQDLPLWLHIEALDVQEAAVAGGHQDRDTSLTRGLADKDLGVQRVAFLHENVDAVEESVDRLRR